MTLTPTLKGEPCEKDGTGALGGREGKREGGGDESTVHPFSDAGSLDSSTESRIKGVQLSRKIECESMTERMMSEDRHQSTGLFHWWMKRGKGGGKGVGTGGRKFRCTIH